MSFDIRRIPPEIINLVAEFTSGRIDGWTKEGIRNRLEKIKNEPGQEPDIQNYINWVLYKNEKQYE